MCFVGIVFHRGEDKSLILSFVRKHRTTGLLLQLFKSEDSGIQG